MLLFLNQSERKEVIEIISLTDQLLEDAKVLKVKNPWGLSPIQFTCAVWHYGLGLNHRQIALGLFGSYEEETSSKIEEFTRVSFERVMSSTVKNVPTYGALVGQFYRLLRTPSREDKTLSILHTGIEKSLRYLGKLPGPEAFRNRNQALESTALEEMGPTILSISWGPIPPRFCRRCIGGKMIAESDYSNHLNAVCLLCGWTFEIRTSEPKGPVLDFEKEPGRQRRRQPSHAKIKL